MSWSSQLNDDSVCRSLIKYFSNLRFPFSIHSQYHPHEHQQLDTSLRLRNSNKWSTNNVAQLGGN